MFSIVSTLERGWRMGKDICPMDRSRLMIIGGPWINSENSKTEQNVVNVRKGLGGK